MEEERKQIEEVMAALPRVFLGKDSVKFQEEVARRLKELEEKKEKN